MKKIRSFLRHFRHSTPATPATADDTMQVAFSFLLALEIC